MGRLVPPCELQVVRYSDWATLAPLAAEWDRLSGGVPFRSWAWQSCWWRHYGGDAMGNGASSLYVVGVFTPSGRLVGLAPWHRARSLARGHVLRFLGSGEVCSEYLSLLCEPEWEEAVADAVAHWLTEAALRDPVPGLRSDRWDLLELTAVDGEDPAMARLAARLETLGNAVHRRPGPPCWRIELPGAWDEYLAQSSKNHRRRLRKLEQDFVQGRATARRAERPEEVRPLWAQLVAFQRRRRRQLGQRSCFESERFVAFHQEATAALLAAGKLLFFSIEKDGQPVAVDYALLGDNAVYAYQAGVDIARLDECPGHLGHYALVRSALDHGMGVLDFLRGDEPYKAGWGAAPCETIEIRAVPDCRASRWRHKLWLAGTGLKRWVRRRICHAH
jgi:CelD/BcsL family acetyltransferase involved in cellulose biosynthesis